MIRLATAFGLALLLTGCGLEGPPVAPQPKERPATGVKVTGDARMGVVWR
ncbi:argininosuccinate lyase [Fluviibacterium sp. DFM31]|uniref:Argininosuccinate lyase n=1 Tax=Meridianimarinicoccus marinus TaxID=3231483 RepID=A0ABV3L2C5_9RHOB